MDCCFFWEFLKGMETTWVEISFSAFQVNLIVRFSAFFGHFRNLILKKFQQETFSAKMSLKLILNLTAE